MLTQQSIMNLADIVADLSPDERERFGRLFSFEATTGQLVPPENMHRWIERYFGSVERVSAQRVVKITNRMTLEETLFNELRSQRPLEARIPAELADEIAKTAPDPFDEPELNTPADTFGRIEGTYTVTASNIAKYDGSHGVIVFREHDPLAFSEPLVVEAVNVAQEWYKRAHEVDRSAIYPLFMWNCLWKSGASIPHGHCQVSLSRGMHYGKIERQRRAVRAYQQEHGKSYFDDMFQAHQSLGLGHQVGDVRIMANLTPLKEKEVVLLAPRLTDDLARTTYNILRCLVENMNVVSFNLVIALPPLAETPEDWSDMPVIVRIVDRGDPLNRTSDFGAMELYAASVVSSDPFRVAESLWQSMDQG